VIGQGTVFAVVRLQEDEWHAGTVLFCVSLYLVAVRQFAVNDDSVGVRKTIERLDAFFGRVCGENVELCGFNRELSHGESFAGIGLNDDQCGTRSSGHNVGMRQCEDWRGGERNVNLRQVAEIISPTPANGCAVNLGHHRERASSAR